MNNFLELKNIIKDYRGEAGSKLLVLDKINFTINEDDYITSVLAPAGCGKTTLLRIISGLDYEYEGSILLKGNKVINKLPFIPENPSSFPWLDVEGNIKIVFRMLDNLGSTIDYKLQELIDLTGLTGYEKHFPDNKSYGFRFRISLARAIAVSSQIILLDDPFKLMNAETKEELLQLIKNISSSRGLRFLISTSNITDSFEISNRIFLMSNNPASVIEDIQIGKNSQGSEQRKNELKVLLEKGNLKSLANLSI